MLKGFKSIIKKNILVEIGILMKAPDICDGMVLISRCILDDIAKNELWGFNNRSSKHFKNIYCI